ncbi:HEAT repeat domain-containing protein, partial [Myxococcus sp. 1LA]
MHDADPEARALAALALGAGSGENARTLLLGALGDREPRVRKAAAQSLSRILGQDVSSVVDLDDTHRRREIRRLATLPVKPVRARLEQPKPAVAAMSVVAPEAVVAAVAQNVVQAQVEQPAYAVAAVGAANRQTVTVGLAQGAGTAAGVRGDASAASVSRAPLARGVRLVPRRPWLAPLPTSACSRLGASLARRCQRPSTPAPHAAGFRAAPSAPVQR